MKKGITFKFIALFSVLLVVIVGLLVTLLLQNVSDYNKDAERSLETAVVLLDRLVETKVKDAIALTELYAASNQLLNGLLNDNTTQVSTFANPIYAELSKHTGLSVMEVGSARGTVLYRAHQPDRSGDDKSNQPMVSVAMDGNRAAGIEMGASGIAIRAIVPIIQTNRVVGTLMMGYGDDFFDVFKETASADVDIFSQSELLFSTDTNMQAERGKSISQYPRAVQEGIEQGLNGTEVTKKYGSDFYHFKPIIDPTKTRIIGVFVVRYSLEAFNARLLRMVAFNGGMIIFVIIFIVFMVLYLMKTLTKPVKQIAQEINRIASYDLSESKLKTYTHILKQTDEIGQMAVATIAMEDNLIQLISSIAKDAEHVASSSEELTATSEQASHSAEEVSKTIEEIANGATDQAKQTSDGAREIDMLGELITQEKHMVDALSASSEAVDTLKNEGFDVLKVLEEKTQENNRASSEVGAIVHETNDSVRHIEQASAMIKSIADQTNLLALNAAIEAARAGEAGRGFAVVADEIRKLAEQSNTFADEITSIIVDLSAKMETAVKSIDASKAVNALQVQSLGKTQEKFEGIAEAIEAVKGVIGSLNTTSDQMLDKKNQIIEIIENLAAISQENAASSEEASASVQEQTSSMEQIASASEALASLAEQMQKNIHQFKM